MIHRGGSTFFFILMVSCHLLVLSSACKKNKGEEDGMPVLGTCKPVDLRGGLTLQGEGIYVYESAGGATIEIVRNAPASLMVTIGYKAYPNFAYQFWGEGNAEGEYIANHENLNGKHIKDRIDKGRTVIFPDGTKMTMVCQGWLAPVTAISIYEGGYAHHLNTICDKVEYSASGPDIAKKLDDQQADGETSTFEITTTGLDFYNIYTENTPGNKVEQRVELGELNKDNPYQVNDWYDDPRIGHT